MPMPLNVLILEDREEDARLVVHELKQADFEPDWRRVDTEAGYLAALDPALDVILADYHVPGWDAMEALTLLQTRGLDIPFIIVSGSIGEDAAVAAIHRGAADYLIKDRLARLGAAVRQAIEGRRLRQERLALDARLRESEARFRFLMEQDRQLVALLNEEGRVLYCTPASAVTLGHTPEELVGRSAMEFVGPGDQEAVGRALADCLGKPGTSVAAAARFRHRDGSLRHFEGTLTSLLHEPAIRAIVVSYEDVTERKHVQRVLDEALERLRRAVSAGNIGLWDWDLGSNKVYFSPEWKAQIGYDDREISDDFDEWQSRVHPDDLDRAQQAVTAYLSGAEATYELEFRFRHKDGSYRNILARGAKVLGEDGTPIRLLGSHADITEHTLLQAQFLQAQKMDSVGRLAGGIAHDFNNLLTVINGTADLAMSNMRESDPLYADLQAIHQAGDRAAALTRQLLAFSRKQILKPDILNLNAVVGDMQDMLRRLIGESITLVFVPSESLASVRADQGQIEQVILNLVINARDAMPDGGSLTIETRDVDLDTAFAAEHPTVQPGRHVRLAISDTGTGMSEADRARIFEPFFTTKAVGKGSGLGLSTVYGIVKQSGGSIWLSSEIGKGTVFTIYLPQVPEKAHKAQARPTRPPERPRGTELILLVEDEEALRRLAVRVLRSAGYAVLDAANGWEAMLLLEHDYKPVDLLLTDVVLPGISGRELAERLAKDHPGLKVLFSSGYTDDAIVRHGVLDKSANFLAKPYTGAQMLAKVREVLDS